MTIHLSSELEALIQKDLERGPYQSADEFVAQAVQMLHERGAFELRRSVETVAEAMGVSRFTIYNYLNAADA